MSEREDNAREEFERWAESVNAENGKLEAENERQKKLLAIANRQVETLKEGLENLIADTKKSSEKLHPYAVRAVCLAILDDADMICMQFAEE